MLNKLQEEKSNCSASKRQENVRFSSFRISRFFAVLCLLLCSILAYAQPKDNAPYSRLGLGDLVQQQFASSIGMGGLSAAFQDPYHINIKNPAAAAFLNATSFEVGLYAKTASLQEGDSNTRVWSGNVNYLALGFPLQNPVNRELERDENPFRWGMQLALIPFTRVGYDVRIKTTHPTTGVVDNVFQGQGGTYKLNFGNGFRYKNLAVGVNAGFLFGSIERRSQSTFVDLPISYSNQLEDEFSVSGIVLDFGTQYRYDFKTVNKKGKLEPNGKSIIVGAFGNGKGSYATRYDRFYTSGNSETTDIDTIINVKDYKGTGALPSTFTVGVMYQNLGKFSVGGEFGIANWSEYNNEIEATKLEDVYNLAVGAEWTPDIKSYNSYIKRMKYRLGYRRGTDPRGTDGDLKYSSMTFGLGMPIISKGSQSYLDWGFEFGTFGKVDGLKENFIRLTLGFAINDSSWFFKRRYN